jgi:hypothetical protein
MVLRLNSEPVIPGEAVAHDKAAQNVVRAQNSYYTKGEEGEGHSESQKRFVINEAA